MKILLTLEYVSIFALSLVLFSTLPYAWWWYPTLILLPDISMIGYAINARIGAIVYNLVHVLLFGVAIYLVGYFLHSSLAELVGVILIGHSSIDRIFGYGLKYPDSFKHTHLGSL